MIGDVIFSKPSKAWLFVEGSLPKEKPRCMVWFQKNWMFSRKVQVARALMSRRHARSKLLAPLNPLSAKRAGRFGALTLIVHTHVDMGQNRQMARHLRPGFMIHRNRISIKLHIIALFKSWGSVVLTSKHIHYGIIDSLERSSGAVALATCFQNHAGCTQLSLIFDRGPWLQACLGQLQIIRSLCRKGFAARSPWIIDQSMESAISFSGFSRSFLTWPEFGYSKPVGFVLTVQKQHSF